MPLALAPELEDLKIWQREQITASRDEAVLQGVTVNGALFDTDPRSQALIASQAVAIAAGQVSGTITWRDADDVTHEMTPTEFMTMATAAMQYVSTVYEQSFVLKDQIKAADNVVAVRAVRW